MNILEQEFIKGFMRMCSDGFMQGWHERNGGNLSYRMKEQEVQSIQSAFSYQRAWTDIGTEVLNLANEYFLVTGSGKYFRNVELNPEANIGIVEIDATGTQYRVVWGLINGAVPTSELPTHLMNHAVKKMTTNNLHRVIYHCHTTNVIALTFVLPLKDEIFTRELWEMATECPVVFPSGVGVVPWMVPGGKDIAVATSEKMHNYDVAIWAHHIFCSGIDFDATFGLAHTVEKSAEILVKMLSMTPHKLNNYTCSICHLAKEFHVSLPEKFLYEK